jgi:hypothetical protein
MRITNLAWTLGFATLILGACGGGGSGSKQDAGGAGPDLAVVPRSDTGTGCATGACTF